MAFPLPQVGLCPAMDMGQKACHNLLGTLVVGIYGRVGPLFGGEMCVGWVGSEEAECDWILWLLRGQIEMLYPPLLSIHLEGRGFVTSS